MLNQSISLEISVIYRRKIPSLDSLDYYLCTWVCLVENVVCCWSNRFSF